MAQQTVKTHEQHIAEIWKMFKESRQETDRKIKDTDRRLKELDKFFKGQWGKLMESLVAGDLTLLLQQKGIKVERILTNIESPPKAEFDIIAVNGREVVIVEVKTTLNVKDVEYFLKKLSKVKQYLPEYKDRTVYGAVAYLRKQTGVDTFSEKAGLFVIRATGNSASITNKENFKPKAFS